MIPVIGHGQPHALGVVDAVVHGHEHVNPARATLIEHGAPGWAERRVDAKVHRHAHRIDMHRLN